MPLGSLNSIVRPNLSEQEPREVPECERHKSQDRVCDVGIRLQMWGQSAENLHFYRRGLRRRQL